MQWFTSLPLVLRVSVAVLALGILFILVAGIPALINRTSERVSGFVEGTPPDLRESTTVSVEATVDGREPTISPQTEEYLGKVRETNIGAVEAFLKIDEKIRQFDSITPEDVEYMGTKRDEIRNNLDQIEELDPPEEYQEQYELFHSAIVDLDEAAGLAYSMASEPDAISPATPERYDLLLDRADFRLQQSDEILRSKSETTSSE